MGIYNADGTRQSTVTRNSFLDIGVDLKRVVNRILKNDTLVKLLYYNSSNVDTESNLTNQQKVAMINDYIKLVPKITKDDLLKSYLVINMDQFTPINDDYNFKSFILSFDIICSPDVWIMDDYMLRPFKIMHELDSIFNNSKLDSLGPITFLSSSQLIINEDLMGYSMFFRVVNFQ